MANLLIAKPLRSTHVYRILTLLVCGEALFGKFFVLGARAAVVGVWEDGDAAARGEEAGNFDVFGIHEHNQVLHDLVDTIFVKIAVVTETEKIELETFALNHLDIRDIADTDFSEVRLPGDRTKTCKLRTVEAYPVVVPLMLVHKGLQHFRSVVHLIICLVTKGVQSLLFSF